MTSGHESGPEQATEDQLTNIYSNVEALILTGAVEMEVQPVTRYGYKDGLAELSEQPVFTLPLVSGEALLESNPEASQVLEIAPSDIVEISFAEPCYERHPGVEGNMAYAEGRMSLTVMREQLEVSDVYEVEVDKREAEATYVGTTSRQSAQSIEQFIAGTTIGQERDAGSVQERSEEDIALDAMIAFAERANERGEETIPAEARALRVPFNAEEAEALEQITATIAANPAIFSQE